LTGEPDDVLVHTTAGFDDTGRAGQLLRIVELTSRP
jgi:hypothetical protein